MSVRNQLIATAGAAAAILTLAAAGLGAGTATAIVFAALYALHLRVACR